MTTVNSPRNYVLGKGEFYFDRFDSQGRNVGERFVGNVTEFNVTFEGTTVDHYSSTGGVREKDRQVLNEINRSGSFITDEISADNLALFLMGTTSTQTQSASTITDEAVNGGAPVYKGFHYQLGVSAQNPAGRTGLVQHTGPSTDIILKQGATTLVAGTDYSVDLARGRIYLLPGGSTITEGSTTVTATYKTGSATFQRVVSGSQQIRGAVRFVSRNQDGTDANWYMPSVLITPNGDFGLISDEWLQMPFSVELLRGRNATFPEALYRDGVAVV